MRNQIKQLEEENRKKQQTLTSADYDKITMLEQSLISATLDKVSFWSTEIFTEDIHTHNGDILILFLFSIIL